MKVFAFLKSRKGVAVEMAIVTLLIVFALCSMIVTVTMYSVDKSVKEEQEFFDDFLIDTIGEDFCASLEWGATYDSEKGTFTRDDYVCFDPAEYQAQFNTDTRELVITVRFIGSLSTLTVEESVTYYYPAITDDEGNIVSESSTRQATNHLLTVAMEKISDGEEVFYQLKQWSYVQ